MQKKLFDEKKVHLIIAVIGVLFAWAGIDAIKQAYGVGGVAGAPDIGIAMTVFGSLMVGAGLQSFFRVRKAEQALPRPKAKK